jgi:hypothetical protein
MNSSFPSRVIYDETYAKVIATVYIVNGVETTIFEHRQWVETKPPILDEIDKKYESMTKSSSFDLSYIPKKERTKEVCLQAFVAGKTLSYVPESLRDIEMCLKFIQRDKQNLSFVPIHLRDEVEKIIS